MPVVTAYQCPWTRRLFTDKKKYSDHLNRYREGVILPDARRRRALKKAQKIRSQLKSFDAIIEWAESNPQVLFDAALSRYPYKSTAKELNRFVNVRKSFFIKITELKLTYSESVSNSHDCPAGGVTNWSRKEIFPDGTPKPLGYPGWRGDLRFVMPEIDYSGSSILRCIGLKTGTGGGSYFNTSKKFPLMSYRYDVRIFEEDFPGLEEYQTLCRLKQKNFNFCYRDEFRYLEDREVN